MIKTYKKRKYVAHTQRLGELLGLGVLQSVNNVHECYEIEGGNG
jgi:hypothetical protein